MLLNSARSRVASICTSIPKSEPGKFDLGELAVGKAVISMLVTMGKTIRRF